MRPCVRARLHPCTHAYICAPVRISHDQLDGLPSSKEKHSIPRTCAYAPMRGVSFSIYSTAVSRLPSNVFGYQSPGLISLFPPFSIQHSRRCSFLLHQSTRSQPPISSSAHQPSTIITAQHNLALQPRSFSSPISISIPAPLQVSRPLHHWIDHRLRACAQPAREPDSQQPINQIGPLASFFPLPFRITSLPLALSLSLSFLALLLSFSRLA